MKDQWNLPEHWKDSPKEPTWAVETGVVEANNRVHADVWHIVLRSPWISHRFQAGQFVMIVSEDSGPFLPRAMAPIQATSDGLLEIYYRVVGEGTSLMARTRPDDRLQVIGPLGSPWVITDYPVALIGRGVGITPLYPIGQYVTQHGGTVHSYLSARAPELLVGLDLFSGLGPLFVHNDEEHREQLITDTFRQHLESGWRPKIVVVSGSHRLMKAVSRLKTLFHFQAWAFIEEKMACGIGWCKGCAIGTQWHLICQDGPALPLDEVVTP